MLLARIYEVFPLLYSHWGNETRIIGFFTETASVTRILEHFGEPANPRRLSPAPAPSQGTGV